MANRRSINSPGVEIREIDLSTRATAPNGTSVLITGFASQGPTSEILNVSTLADFEAIYGTPTNAAERYFYYTVRQQFVGGTNATVNVARLPYGEGAGEGVSSKYTALVFPVIPVQPGETLAAAVTAATPLFSAEKFYFGGPTLLQLTESQYAELKQGMIEWDSTAGGPAPTFAGPGDIPKAGLVILNEAKTTINEKFEGYYFSLADNSNLNPNTDYDDALTINTISTENAAINSYDTIPLTRLSFAVSATSGQNINSLSQTIENVPTFNISPETGYNDTAIFSLFKVRTTPFEKDSLTLSYVIQEGYAASFYVNRTIQDPNGGKPLSNFVETVVNDRSPNLTVFVNPNISKANWLDEEGLAQKIARQVRKNIDTAATGAGYLPSDSVYPIGVYSPSLNIFAQKLAGNVGEKLSTVLNLAENADVINIDVVVDGGLSTIAAVTSLDSLDEITFDDTIYNDDIKGGVEGLYDNTGYYSPGDLVTGWKNITDQFVEFTTFRRKDCIFISDPLRHIFVQGVNYKTLDDKTKNFSNNIYWPLRNSYQGYNTSYATTYGNWVRVVDSFTNKPVWAPFSGFASAIYTNNDAVAYPWGAPAGLNRGVVTGAVDVAVNPQQKQRDLLYKISVNPVVNFPQEGFTIMGQKTLLKAPSAFDRINVRRLFLYLEKSVLSTTKFFVFEPNTTFTRNRLVNTISPVFDLAKNTQGVYDYLIVCNDTNNPPDIVDDNTLVVDIYVKPTRTAEFILVNFYATRTNQNFQELLQ